MEANSDWLFLTNHGALLLSIAGDPTIELSELARLAGISARAAEEIVADLVAEGYLVRRRDGSSVTYEINREARLRHPLFEDVEIGPLVDALQRPPDPARERTS
jgi:hypothetical protein